MALKTKITLIVAMSVMIYAALNVTNGYCNNLGALRSIFSIAAVISFVIWVFDHYGWRMPLLSKFATSPNLRGTWKLETVEIVKIKEKQSEKNDGYFSIWQSDREIKFKTLWSDGDVSVMYKNAPTAVNDGKICFTGTYSNAKTEGGGDRGFVAYLTEPPITTLRYRTDHGDTGEFKMTSRVSNYFDTYQNAENEFTKEVRLLEKVLFALKPM